MLAADDEGVAVRADAQGAGPLRVRLHAFGEEPVEGRALGRRAAATLGLVAASHFALIGVARGTTLLVSLPPAALLGAGLVGLGVVRRRG